jgi:hypothetical protein
MIKRVLSVLLAAVVGTGAASLGSVAAADPAPSPVPLPAAAQDLLQGIPGCC